MMGKRRNSLGCALSLTSALSQKERPSQKSELGDGEAAIAAKPHGDMVFPGLSISYQEPGAGVRQT